MAQLDPRIRYFSLLGDSISTLAGYNPPECGVFYDWQMKHVAGILTPEDTWWGKAIEALGGQLLVNHSWAGSTVCRLPGCEIESYGCSHGRTGALRRENRSPEVVMILMGLNDMGYGVDAAAFSEGYGCMLERVRQHEPGAQIWCLTIPNLDGCGARVEAYNRAICACGTRMGCRVIDLYRKDAPCQTLDGYHPTAKGMQTIARLVLEAV